MTDTANTTQPETDPVQPQLAVLPLRWKRSLVTGCYGTAYCADINVNGAHYRFVIDQPSKGRWAARGWKDRVLFLSRDRIVTLKGTKAAVEAIVRSYLDESRGGAL
jgi:hypothetical protein